MATQDYPVSQVWGLRTLFVLIPIALLAPRYGGYRALLPHRIRPQLLRAVLFLSTTLLIVTGLSLLPLAQMVTIVFSSPIFIAALAPIFLKEQVSTTRWLTIGIGFIGVLVILRPDHYRHFRADCSGSFIIECITGYRYPKNFAY